MSYVQSIKEKIESNLRIDREEAAMLFQNATTRELMELASVCKRRVHGNAPATYLIMAIVNYTNICVAKCSYCSFYRLPHQSGGYLLNLEQVSQKVKALVDFGGTLVGFNGGFNPKLRIQDYAAMFQEIRARFPQVEFFEMTVAEFMFSCKVSRVNYDEGAKILRDAGTRWVTGGGAEVLDDGFRRRHSPGKYTVADYFSAQRAILNAGMGSTATMVIGFDETIEERLSHLETLRYFQDDIGGLLPSFLCWTYKPFHNELGGNEISTEEYLRWLAVSRIYLDNFKHIRTSVLTQNEKALDGLSFGADDFDLPTEDEVTQKAGATVSLEFESILRHGRSQGHVLEHRTPWQIDEGKSLNSMSKEMAVPAGIEPATPPSEGDVISISLRNQSMNSSEYALTGPLS